MARQKIEKLHQELSRNELRLLHTDDKEEIVQLKRRNHEIRVLIKPSSGK